MLNKSFGGIYFHFNILNENTAKKWVLKFAFFGTEESVLKRSISHYLTSIIKVVCELHHEWLSDLRLRMLGN